MAVVVVGEGGVGAGGGGQLTKGGVGKCHWTASSRAAEGSRRKAETRLEVVQHDPTIIPLFLLLNGKSTPDLLTTLITVMAVAMAIVSVLLCISMAPQNLKALIQREVDLIVIER